LIVTFSFVITISIGSNSNQRHIDGNYYSIGAEEPSFFMGDDGYYTFTKLVDRDFRILQLTDLHIGGGIFCVEKDKKALDAVFAMVKRTQPDLIIFTGDIMYPFPPQSGNINNIKTAKQFISMMEKLQVPWTIAFGNHDMESYSLAKRKHLSQFFTADDLKYSVYTENPAGYDIHGYGNQIINIRNADGTLNTSLVIFDSNQYINGNMFKYDIIRDNQVEWYKDSILALSVEENGIGDGEVVSSLAFFHIPLNEYQTAWDLYTEGNAAVEYLYGGRDEEILAPTLKDTLPQGKLFEEMVKLGSTKATFCGHNHKNNFAIIYQGIQLSFSNTIVYLGLFGIDKTDAYRGGTLITIDSDSGFNSELVFLAEAD
ncbi:MAG: hypothetical protein EOM87_05435, partial [Clostridia bacterium]|nr:hypothetical protein [Clostridia bacterium]